MKRASTIPGELLLLFLLFPCGCSQTAASSDAAIEKDTTVAPDLAAPPLRKLVQKPLFGQMPLNNRVSHPEFTIFDGFSWFPWCAKCKDLPVRMFLPGTPLGQSAVRLPALAQEEPYTLVGMVKGMDGPLEVSVWLGRKVVDNKPPDFSDAEAALVGVYPAQGHGEVSLAEDRSTQPRVLDGIHWMRVAVWIKEPPVGWANLIVTDSLGHGLYVTSPVAIPMSTQPKYQQTGSKPQRIKSSRARALKAWRALRRRPRRVPGPDRRKKID